MFKCANRIKLKFLGEPKLNCLKCHLERFLMDIPRFSRFIKYYVKLDDTMKFNQI
jgi:hypothetical protein